MPNKIAGPSVGADIEVFLFNEEKKPVPCVGLFKGTKEEPWRPEYMPEGFALQEDNVMLEYNIPAIRPGSDIYTTYYLTNDMLKKETASKNLTYEHTPVVYMPPEALASKQAQTFGCEADFDAYTGGVQRNRPLPPRTFRTAGGHIHIGGPFNCPPFVSILLLEAALQSRYRKVLTPDPQAERPRMNLYGASGAFRTKPYGVEYRTPSNAWASNDASFVAILQAALQVAQWLSTTDATQIRDIYRSINWTKFRQLINRTSHIRIEDYMKPTLEIINQAGIFK